MVLTDSIDKHECFPGYDSIKFIRPQERVRPEIEHISSWEFSREVQPGVFSLDDYDFERPAVDLRLGKPVPRKYKPSDYEWFDYPGLFTKKGHGEQLAQVRGEEFGSQFERAARRDQCPRRARRLGVHARRLPAGGSELQAPGRDRPTHDLEFSDYEAMPEPGGSDVSLQVRGDDDRAAVSAAADHAEAVRAGAADGGGGRAAAAKRSTPTSTGG